MFTKSLQLTQPILSGEFSISLFYFNLFSTENNQEFLISNRPSLNTVSLFEIGYGNIDIFLGNSIQNISIKIPSSDNLLNISNYRCKIDNTYFQAFYSEPDKINCFISMSSPSVKYISIWFVDDRAYNGQFQVSTNSLRIFFISQITLLNINPLASLLKEKDVVIYSSPFIDVVGSNVTYKCNFIFDLKETNVFAVYDPLKNTFSCQIKLESDKGEDIKKIKIMMESKIESNPILLFSNNYINFYWLRKVNLERYIFYHKLKHLTFWSFT
jgi:hypothetical protein